MLLTHSQVSIVISVAIVVSFTLALFLSGYAIQQRTLRELRRAIKPEPRPSPKIYLPDRFMKSTTELEDGTVVDVDVPESGSGNVAHKDAWIIDVKPTVPEDQAVQKPVKKPQTKPKKKNKKKKSATSETEDDPEKPISRAERRRRIKEDIRKLSQAQEPVYYQRRLW